MNPADPERGHSLWSDAWHRLRRNRLALAGGIFLVALSLLCAFGPVFSQAYQSQDLELGATPPRPVTGWGPTRSGVTSSQGRSTGAGSR